LDPGGRQAPRVVVVDDYPFMRDLLSEVLRRAGHEVAGEAGSAAELMAGLAGWRPDILVLDILLPDGNGVEVTKSVLEKMPALKVLVISGLEEDGKLTDSCIAAGAKGFLPKPFSGEALTNAIAAL
jgi:two-component system chemotaxis response regulator CheY